MAPVFLALCTAKAETPSGQVPLRVAGVWLEQGFPAAELQPRQKWIQQVVVEVSGLNKGSGGCAQFSVVRVCRVTKGTDMLRPLQIPDAVEEAKGSRVPVMRPGGGCPWPLEGGCSTKGTSGLVRGVACPQSPGSLLCTAGAEVPMEACCTDGHQMATQHKDCSLPYTSESKECRMVQEQCCQNQLEELHCAAGISLADEGDSCAAPQGDNASLEAMIVKRCCHCCLLGRAAQAQGQSCEYNLMVGYQCGLVFRACCVKGQENADFAPGDIGDLQETAKVSEIEEEQEDPYLNDRCRGGGPCKQQCRDTGQEVVCSCFVGYQLLPDGVSCEDINECIKGSQNCRLGETCINTVGSFRCQRDSSCGTGYELTEDNDCKDIDECESGIHNCLPDFICQNTLGSFRCRPKLQCKSGFIQDALGNCIDINECLSISAPCPVGQTCINTEGSYTCQKNVPNCGRGYHLNEEGTRCVDVDECSPPAEPCGPGHMCVNSLGSFRCECKAGYYFDGISRTCVDINECRRYPGRLCGHKCENTPGSYYCSCTIGFRLSSDGRSCEDVNECHSSPCSQECANVYGSYQCYCRRGYQLSDVDGTTCEDIDECALPTGGHICSYRCINIPGSFQCSCPSTGYRLAPNGRNCQDIDECVTGIHNCSINETCFNIQGSFRCLAFECPENYRRSADTLRQEKTDTIRCIKSCRPNDVTCVLAPVHTISHTVVSLPTFREFTRPEEIIFLRAVTPAHPANHADIIFDITDGNLRDSFDIIKRYMDGMTVGVVRQVRPIVGPFHAVLKLEMNYVVGGVVSHRNVVNVHIFVSEYWF
uniref:Fibulin-1 n=1 Tax=Sus scrofa TaxID=9823 RepID=A0A8D1UTG6_PIG